MSVRQKLGELEKRVVGIEVMFERLVAEKAGAILPPKPHEPPPPETPAPPTFKPGDRVRVVSAAPRNQGIEEAHPEAERIGHTGTVEGGVEHEDGSLEVAFDVHVEGLCDSDLCWPHNLALVPMAARFGGGKA